MWRSKYRVRVFSRRSKAVDRFLGEAKALDGYSILELCRYMRLDVPVTGTISPWH